ncbi:mitochondrial dynamin GTPase Msp1, partial [Cryomyces antarcticus]
MRQILSRLDPEAGQKEEARQKQVAASKRLQGVMSSREDEDLGYDERPRTEDLVLTPYEQTIAMEVVHPEEIPISFD